MKDKTGIIKQRLPAFTGLYESCSLCVRQCGVNRIKGERGFCSSDERAKIYSYGPHYGEEPVISGKRGSGTIFFSSCVMKCVYCQNHIFSQSHKGREVSFLELSKIMMELQKKGCHNINLVSPTQYLPEIIRALEDACSRGFNIPIVYNTGGYDTPEVIELLDGIVDIYLPDMRYSEDIMSERYSYAPGYTENNRQIVSKMFKQSDYSIITEDIMERGLIIRLLVLPNDISGTRETLRFVAKYISNKIPISLMSQYYPAYLALQYKKLSRRLPSKEFSDTQRVLDVLGFENGWIQPFGSVFDSKLAGENFDFNIY